MGEPHILASFVAAGDAGLPNCLVLCQGTGTLDLVDLSGYALTGRINATSGSTSGSWTLPTVASIAPNTAAIGSSFTLTIDGSNLQGITGVEFLIGGSGTGGDMMDGGPTTGEDPQEQILSTAAAGTRQVRLGTNHGGMSNEFHSLQCHRMS